MVARRRPGIHPLLVDRGGGGTFDHISQDRSPLPEILPPAVSGSECVHPSGHLHAHLKERSAEWRKNRGRPPSTGGRCPCSPLRTDVAGDDHTAFRDDRADSGVTDRRWGTPTG